MRVLFLTNIPSPYRVDFFNELGKYCELTVVYERELASDRDEKWISDRAKNYKQIILKGINVQSDKAVCFSVVKYLKKNEYDYIIVANYATITGMIANLYMRLKNIKFGIEIDGAIVNSSEGLKGKLKKCLISSAEFWLGTSKSSKEYFLNYGAKEDGIYKYPFTSTLQKDILDKPLLKNEKQEIKNRLDIKESKVILSIGQFIHRKGYDVLLKACTKIDKDVGVYIVGGIATEEYISLKNELGLENVHFVDFKTKDEIKSYYQMADLFVLPTREDIWGLVINEAMSYGLPVITTNRCVAGLELIKDGDNGYIVPIENEIDLVNKINKILFDEKIIDKMSVNSLNKIKEYTIENMAKRHMEIFNELQ